MQPVKRFDLDAAILFSDILVIPYALGQDVRFEDNVGPVLGPMPDVAEWISAEQERAARLAPVYEAVRDTRAVLAPEKALIGFAGAPWTLAAYMVEGRGSLDQRKARLLAYRAPDLFADLIDRLAEAVAGHLIRQIEAGADVVQLFDSWAGGLPLDAFESWVLVPTRKIVSLVRARHPGARIIGFPRGVSQTAYARYARETGVDGVSLDTGTPLSWAAEMLAQDVAIQGNLDPLVLVAGGEALAHAVDNILRMSAGTPFIFNLGHGVVPETPPEHVAELVARVRGA